MSRETALILTTINSSSHGSLPKLRELRDEYDLLGIAVGDDKGPESFEDNNWHFLAFGAQKELPFQLASLLPKNHYARKNIGYLYAIQQGVEKIFETDDDNTPLPDKWSIKTQKQETKTPQEKGWVNLYRYFCEEAIWPRGYPLEYIRSPAPTISESALTSSAPIQQCVVNGSPDVDAIWRLLFNKEIHFNSLPSVALTGKSWCPFNSQSTWWFKDAYPLLYLPSTCTMRETDIIRSYVAMACLAETKHRIVFHAPEMHQFRNEHRLLADFELEQKIYLYADNIMNSLYGLHFSNHNLAQKLLQCYELLAQKNIVASQEIERCKAWIEDLENFTV